MVRNDSPLKAVIHDWIYWRRARRVCRHKCGSVGQEKGTAEVSALHTGLAKRLLEVKPRYRRAIVPMNQHLQR